ncbi:MAG: GerAB/ArcD/ProY family transporter [Negativicutes bacterium]|nr:GerAB/ArcD/ProY family transporter [Negativicutes bacterium]
MSYQSGRMGVAEGIALTFTITFTTAFLTLPAEAIDTSGELGWLSVIVAGLSTMAMLFLLIYVFERIPGDLFFVATSLFGKPGAYLISMFYIIMFLSMATLWIRQFADNTLITAMPLLDFSIAVGWYALGAAFLLFFGIEAIARANYVILPFGIGGTILVLALLSPLWKFNYLLPWQGTGMASALIKGGVLVGSNAGALLLAVIAKSFQSPRVLKAAAVFGLGGSVLVKTISILIFTMVYGTAVAMERALPFFEMSRLVSLNRYIQRIESIFVILWVITGILGIAISIYMSLYLMTRLVNLPTMKPLIPVVTLLLAHVAMIPSDVSSVLAFEGFMVRGYYLIGIYVIPLLLFAATLLKEKRGKKCASGQ